LIGGGSLRVGYFRLERNCDVVGGKRETTRSCVVARGGSIDVRLCRKPFPERSAPAGLPALLARDLDADCSRGQAHEMLDLVQIALAENRDLPQAPIAYGDFERSSGPAVCKRGVAAGASRIYHRPHAARQMRAAGRDEMAPLCVFDEHADVRAARKQISQRLGAAAGCGNPRQVLCERDEFVGSHTEFFGEEAFRLCMQTNLVLADLLASFYEGCPDAIAVYDPDGRFVACNPAASQLSGLSEAAMAGTHYHRHVQRVDHPAVDEAFASALAGFIEHFETMMRTSEGEIPVEVHLFPAVRDGAVVGVFAQAHDLLALRAAEESLELNQQRFRSLFEYHPDAIMALKADGRISRVNVALEATTGFYGEQIIGKDWSKLIAPECRDEALDAFRPVSRGEAVELDSCLLDRVGNRIDVQLKLVPLHVAGRIDGAYAIAKNVTAQRSAERAIALQGERIRELYIAAAARGDSVEAQIDNTLALGCRLFGFDYGYVTRFDDAVVTILNAVGEGSGVEPGAAYAKNDALSRHLIGDRQTLFVPDLDEPPWDKDPARESAPWKSYFATKLVVGNRDFGALVFAARHVRANGIAELDRDLLQLMALFVAAALERAQHAERIEQLAFYDSLTGLPNRVLFDDRIRQTMSAAKRYNRGFAVMYLDLDQFKEINDQFGHPAGDLVLKAVADRLVATLRESDTVARFGGDEFVILEPVVNGAADASDLAKKIVVAMQAPVQVDDLQHTVHTSIGIALYPQDGVTTSELMEHADSALYRAKRSGRNRWQFYSS
jgi:diguanylate cyclase (GGDEF)-like protein/PAS domain S-box-containing protein